MSSRPLFSALVAIMCALGFTGCQSVKQGDHVTKTNAPMKDRHYYELTPEQRDQQYQRQVNQNSTEGYQTK